MSAAKPSPLDRLAALLDRRPWIVDSVFLALPLVLMALALMSTPTVTSVLGLTPLAHVLTFAMILALAFRRMWPVPMATVVAVAGFLLVAIVATPGVAAISPPIMVATVAKFGSARASRVFLGVGLAASLLVMVPFVGTAFVNTNYSPIPMDAGTIIAVAVGAAFSATCIMVAWIIGSIAATGRRRTAAIEERNRLLIRERAHEAAAAATDERLRIARELHDVVSHSISVMIAQADGGRYAAAADPRAAEAALGTIAATGRTSLAELRRMLGVLRTEEEPDRTRPQPMATTIGELIASVKAAGLPVEYRLSADVTGLPAGLSLAVYRLTQEALTNTLKHAGPEARSEVTIAADGGDLLVSVVDHDPRPGASAEPGRGSGLKGMLERAALYSGTVAAGREGDGFAVRARFPGVVGVAAPPPDPALPGRDPAAPSTDGPEAMASSATGRLSRPRDTRAALPAPPHPQEDA